MRTRIAACLVALLPASFTASSQQLRALDLDLAGGITIVRSIDSAGSPVAWPHLPLFTVEVNDTAFGSAAVVARSEGDSIVWRSGPGVEGSLRVMKAFTRGWKAELSFRNASNRPIRIANLVPLGSTPDHVFIKSAGPEDYPHRLSRSTLFRPGTGPIGVILPDNAWEMGFCSVEGPGGWSLTAIARRSGSTGADERRFRTILQPLGTVTYEVYIDLHEGDWRDGLRVMFRDRWLYDLETFDNTLFERTDLRWIRESYLLCLQFAWDHQYYEAVQRRHTFEPFLASHEALLGGFDVYMLWPTWPRLGVDRRNQWDMYRDLPGGLAELRRQAAHAHARGTRFFISYNPWDESTRSEEHVRGLEEMLRAIDADGVVLDTWGQSSKEFQAAADRVKPGVVLYSEGMAIPKDMPGIVAGRVHDAIFLPPPLNLNKLIKPEFGIFRVIQLAEGRIHREIAVALFNGYGLELNIMRPGRPDWMEEEFRYLGRAVRVLRENSTAFLSRDWTPLIPSRAESVWVNRWPGSAKTIYTVLSLRPEGFSGPLFPAEPQNGLHYVSLWHHEELTPISVDGKWFVPSTVDGFSRAWLDSRREANVDCIALLPQLLTVDLRGDSLRFDAPRGTRIVVSAGLPSYGGSSAEFPRGARTISLRQHFGGREEKFVVQLFGGKDLLDERVMNVPLATPRLITKLQRTSPATSPPPGMVEIPAGLFQYKSRRSFLSPNETVPYPGDSVARATDMRRYFIDRYPVTNAQYQAFLKATRYAPKDDVNFLKHWSGGRPPKGLENHPVVYVGLDDARAYARWAGKRLPTECEWQYAAQGTDGRKYPWGNELDSSRCNAGSGHTTAVDAYPAGAGPFGVMDLVGNVWQLTDEVYDNGTFYFGMIRGGSHYDPSSSWWYVKGGVQPVDNPQILLLVSPGFDRCGTVGFRCVKDAQ